MLASGFISFLQKMSHKSIFFVNNINPMINCPQRNKGDFLLHFLQHRSKPLVESLDQILNSKMDTFQSLCKILWGWAWGGHEDGGWPNLQPTNPIKILNEENVRFFPPAVLLPSAHSTSPRTSRLIMIRPDTTTLLLSTATQAEPTLHISAAKALWGVQCVGRHIAARVSIISAYGRKCVFDREAYLEREDDGHRTNKGSVNHTAMSCIH